MVKTVTLLLTGVALGVASFKAGTSIKESNDPAKIKSLVSGNQLHADTSNKFRRSVLELEAQRRLSGFRKSAHAADFKSNGVWYDVGDIESYLKDKFTLITQHMKADYDPKTQKWAVGFHWTLRGDSLDFIVVPILVDIKSEKVVRDYYDDVHAPQANPNQTPIYNHKKDLASTTKDPDPDNAYDAGHLWP